MTPAEKLDACGGLASLRQVYGWPWLGVRQVTEREGSRLRLQAWITAGAPRGPFVPRVVPARFYAVVSEVLAAIPAPVAWFASRAICFAVLPTRAAGLAALPPAAPGDVEEAAHLVLVDGGLPSNDLRSVIAHETAHCWTSRVTAPRDAPASDFVAAFRGVLADTPEPEWSPEDRAALTAHARGEELATFLARAWGFTGRGTDMSALLKQGSSTYVMQGFK